MENLEKILECLDRKYREPGENTVSAEEEKAYGEYFEQVDKYIAEIPEEIRKQGFQYVVVLKHDETPQEKEVLLHE